MGFFIAAEHVPLCLKGTTDSCTDAAEMDPSETDHRVTVCTLVNNRM